MFANCTHYCESSKNLEGDHGMDRVPQYRLPTSLQKGPNQKLFFDLKKNNKDYKKAKMKGALGCMTQCRE